ncbi:MAG: NusG domain II-containing protein [Fibrobacteria bacterium]
MFQSGAFFRPLDAALVILVTAASAWGFVAFRVSAGSKAVVYIANAKYAWYELSGEKHQVDLPTRIGPVRLEVGEGAARVLSSPCPNKICIKTGKVARVHGEIVCVPAHLLVVIEGPEAGSKAGVDAITY